MDVQADKPGDHEWLSDAACALLTPAIPFHWAEIPSGAEDAALAICAACPVIPECRQDMSNSGERYKYQVRGGLRMWTDDVDLIPEPQLYVRPPPPKRPPGRPADGFVKSTHLKDKISLSRDASDEYSTPMQLHSHIPETGRRRIGR